MLAELMKIANAFAISDTAMRPIRLSANGLIQEQPAARQSAQAGGSGSNQHERKNNNNNNGKRKDGQPDAQYGNRQVAAVQGQEAPGVWRAVGA